MFLNPIMLACVGAAVVPIVLHLLSRARFRTVSWGGMLFLPGADLARPREQVRSRFRQVALLALRSAIVVTLAVAMARPAVRRGASGVTGGATDTERVTAVIVLDRSASMAVDEQGRSRLDLAKQAAVDVLASLHRGDAAAVIFVGDAPGGAGDQSATDFTTDLQALASRITEARAGTARADLAPAIDEAVARLIERATPARSPGATAHARELYVITDRQAASWSGLTAQRADGIRARVASSTLR